MTEATAVPDERKYRLAMEIARFEMRLMILERCPAIEARALSETYRSMIRQRRHRLSGG
ncbi:hypothetical protein [Mangrovitalea sediminis]|uniref:hypothetical protein n=1 Tax=Mangrovitalea sediminis TaxID=1982043 RepID=UPI0013040256|nr:hypothetical protein [Mangrovitalea sediminis]